MATFRKVEFLDYLRAVAIIFIACYHYVLEVTLYHIRPSVKMSFDQNIKLLEVFPHDSSFAWLGNFLVMLAAQGYQFVGVFIFISGFGLTYSKLTKGARSLAWIKRIIRLLPQFQIAILFALLVNYISLHYLRRYLIATPMEELYPYFRLLLYPFIWTDFYGLISRVNPSLWFSGLILQFYIFYDVLYWILLKIKPWMFLVLTLVITVAYRYVALFQYDGDPLLFSLLPVRLFEFGLGMAAAYVYAEWKKDIFYGLQWWWIMIGAVTWWAGFRLGFTEYGRVVNDLLTTIGLMIVCTIVFRSLQQRLVVMVLGAIGMQSYWLYLLHNQPITQFLTPWTFMQWDAAGMSGLTLLIGMLGIFVVMTLFSMVMQGGKREVRSR